MLPPGFIEATVDVGDALRKLFDPSSGRIGVDAVSVSIKTPVDVDWVGVQVQLERELQRQIRRELQTQPTVTLLLQSPDEPAKALDGRRRRRTTAPQVAAS